MRKKIIVLSAIAALTTASFASTEVEDRLSEMEAKIKKLEKKLKKSNKKLNKVKAHDAGDNIKWGVDFRTAVDKIDYETAEGKEYGNDALLTNRLLLNMGYATSENTIFKGALSYHKVFGAAPAAENGYPQRGYGYDSFDWVNAQSANSDKMTVKEAYWLYMNDTFMGTDVSWTASVGRRPSTNGLLVNMRNDTKAQSPLGHIIDVEFDGASFKFGLDKVTGIDGMSWKLCLGRGLSNATPRFDMSGGLDSKGDYSEDDAALDTIDLAGFIFVPYDDGQYSVSTNMFKANNLPGFEMVDMTGAMSSTVTNTGMMKFIDSDENNISDSWAFNENVGMKTIGDLSGAAISFKADGIGDGINDFLDDTTFFASWAQSKTNPDNNSMTMDMNAVYTMVAQSAQTSDIESTEFKTAFENAMSAMASGDMDAPMKESGMLGSTKSETGTSIYMGVQMPCLLTEDGRIGVEYNKGSKYWRSFTYAEDTMAGSKLATRGSAWEVYYIKPLNEALRFEVRYTSISYDYTGSQAFFGDDGTPMTMAEAKSFGMDPIEKATDLRASITYRF
ncbi:MAG: DUF3373 family protein [Campylobacterota bacterium]|nr:DUF3373 family protein [Campylobacterota bacterium]